jgi:hypothetical protein
MRRQVTLLIACAGLMLFPAGARGATVVFGSNLSEDPSGTVDCTAGCSSWNTAVGAGTTTNGVAAPVSGVVTQFTLKTGSVMPGYRWGEVSLRTIGLVNAGSWTGFKPGTAPVRPSATSGLQTFSTHLPISRGEFLALDVLPGPEASMTATHNGGPAGYALTSPRLPTDGSTSGAPESWGELLLQARIDRGAVKAATRKKCKKRKHRAATSKKKRCKKRKRR